MILLIEKELYNAVKLKILWTREARTFEFAHVNTFKIQGNLSLLNLAAMLRTN